MKAELIPSVRLEHHKLVLLKKFPVILGGGVDVDLQVDDHIA